MKELISAVLFVVSLYSGTAALKNIHAWVRKAALVKASQGLPSLSEMNRKLQRPTRETKK